MVTEEIFLHPFLALYTREHVIASLLYSTGLILNEIVLINFDRAISKFFYIQKGLLFDLFSFGFLFDMMSLISTFHGASASLSLAYWLSFH